MQYKRRSDIPKLASPKVCVCISTVFETYIRLLETVDFAVRGHIVRIAKIETDGSLGATTSRHWSLFDGNTGAALDLSSG